MTEAEWLNSESPQKMRQHLEDMSGASERKLRLFAVAACRRAERWFIEPCQSSALETLERYADGLATTEELRTAETLVGRIDGGRIALSEAFENEDQDARDAAHYAADAITQATCNDPSGIEEPTYYHRLYDTIMNLVDSAGHGASTLDPLNGRSLISQAAERRALGQLLRDIFGDLFRPVDVAPYWLTSTVTTLARQMYESRDFSLMQILADALQDAGCENEVILAHCRGDGPHVRGCWVVDALLAQK